MADDQFVKAMMDKGVMVRPSANFGSPGNIRVTIGDREANEVYISSIESLKG